MSNSAEQKEIVCVICPNSCRLNVYRDPKTDEVIVEGNQCARGKDYGINEFTEPVRMLITTMRIEDGVLPVIPVRSNKELPKTQIFNAVKVVNETVCHAPIKMGDVIISDLLGLGVDVIASRDMKKVELPVKQEVKDDTIRMHLHSILLKYFYKDHDKLSDEDRRKLDAVEDEILSEMTRKIIKYECS